MSQPHAAARPVTVSVVSHGQWSLIEPLLRQLDSHCARHLARVIVTANVPEPIELDPAWRFPVQVVRNERPTGFGANHNAALRACDSPWFLILNPDIRLDRDVLSELLDQADIAAGLVAPRVVEPGKAAPESHRDLVTPFELMRRRRPDHHPPARPAWVPGMFMLVRKEAFAAVGGFDHRYFMYCEDVDLCARLRLADWRLQVAENVRVTHEAQRASNNALRPLAWHLASLLRLWTSRPFWRYAALLRAAPE